MKAAPLVVAVVTVATLPLLLSSFGCNKKEDAPPVPSATPVVVAPPTTAAPSATALLPVQPSAAIPLLKTGGPRLDGGAVNAGAKNDAGITAAKIDAAVPPPFGFPPGMPTVALPHPSALPGLASSVVGGIIQRLPPPIIPPPNPSQ